MQNVIVTGGSRGLGLAMARTLAASGYRIIALARGSTEELMAASRTAAVARSSSVPATCPTWAGLHRW
jgi:3-oxoacyl-[acyl-carrier protein] reductase